MSYWQQQTDKPLFPKLLWSRPETKFAAGKLLIIGGQAQEFAHVAECYAAAEKAGAGTIRILMPQSTAKYTKGLLNIEYAPSNNSGSFAQTALEELLAAADWADGVLLAGDMGKNSETSLMLEKFIGKYDGMLIISSAALVSLTTKKNELLKCPNTVWVFDEAGLRKLGIELDLEVPLTSDISNNLLSEQLHKISKEYPSYFVAIHRNNIWAAFSGRVVNTPTKSMLKDAVLSAFAATWAIQNPNQVFEAIACSSFYLK